MFPPQHGDLSSLQCKAVLAGTYERYRNKVFDLRRTGMRRKQGELPPGASL